MCRNWVCKALFIVIIICIFTEMKSSFYDLIIIDKYKAES